MAVKKRRKNDIIIIIIILIISLSMLLINQGTKDQVKGESIEIKIDNQLYGTYLLNEDQVIVIDDEKIHNVIVIKDGSAYMQESNCFNQDCVNHKAIYTTGEQIVCLPNKILIEVKSKQEGDIDTLSE